MFLFLYQLSARASFCKCSLSGCRHYDSWFWWKQAILLNHCVADFGKKSSDELLWKCRLREKIPASAIRLHDWNSDCGLVSAFCRRRTSYHLLHLFQYFLGVKYSEESINYVSASCMTSVLRYEGCLPPAIEHELCRTRLTCSFSAGIHPSSRPIGSTIILLLLTIRRRLTRWTLPQASKSGILVRLRSNPCRPRVPYAVRLLSFSDSTIPLSLPVMRYFY